jgi:adenylate kinase family enzyme
MQEFTQSCSQLKQRKNTLEIFGEVHMSRSRRFRREQKVEQKLATAAKAKADAERLVPGDSYN